MTLWVLKAIRGPVELVMEIASQTEKRVRVHRNEPD